MTESIRSAWEWLSQPTFAAQLTGFLLLALAAYLAYVVAKRILLTTIGRIVRRTSFQWDDTLQEFQVFERIANLAPAVAVYYGVALIPSWPEAAQIVIARVAGATIVLLAVLAVGALLSAVNAIYSATPVGENRPIKGYIQVAKILLYVVGVVVIVSALIDRSPLLFLSGIGAMTAVLLFIFRDTILAFVASLQIASYDLVRVGDWIEAPRFGADGDVIDIALHTIKVQNWDKTVTTIPTHLLVDGSFKNWRGMSESGGRRIKRSIHVDMNTIRFLSEDDLSRFEQFSLLHDYVGHKREELQQDATRHAGEPQLIVNARRLTNVGTFRFYLVEYLRRHPKIHRGMTQMVRQLSPTPDGLPLEIYAFTNVTAWGEYEDIQADIFDHVLAIAPEFGLRVFQHPAGRDFEAALGRQSVRPSTAAD